ncbi:MAG: hypothetical protein FJ100_23250 [Deltaproteobacteria bacterium]|nr:hypothetical protein [Deltaproteobacteria bacterium]
MKAHHRRYAMPSATHTHQCQANGRYYRTAEGAAAAQSAYDAAARSREAQEAERRAKLPVTAVLRRNRAWGSAWCPSVRGNVRTDLRYSTQDEAQWAADRLAEGAWL